MSDRVNRPLKDPLIKWDKPHRPDYKLNQTKIAELFSQVENMDTFELKNFSAINKIPLSIIDEDGNNLIHKILKSDNPLKSEILRLNVIKFLVSNGANPDMPNSDNNTPLHIACEKQYCEIISYLLELGVDPNYQDNTNMTPLHYLLNGKIDICEPDRTIRNFVKSKKLSNEKVKNDIIIAKKKIWKHLIDNKEPLIESLKNTIMTIENDEGFINILEKFQINFNKKLLKIDEKTDKSQLITQLIEPAKSNLFNYVFNKFRNFEDSKDFEIHTKTNDSWTDTKSLNLATIRNSDNKKNLKKLMTDTIKEIIKYLKSNINTQAGGMEKAMNPDTPLFTPGIGVSEAEWSEGDTATLGDDDETGQAVVTIQPDDVTVLSDAGTGQPDDVTVLSDVRTGQSDDGNVLPGIAVSEGDWSEGDTASNDGDQSNDGNDRTELYEYDILDWDFLTLASNTNDKNFKITQADNDIYFESYKYTNEYDISMALSEKINVNKQWACLLHIEDAKDDFNIDERFNEELTPEELSKRFTLDKATWLDQYIQDNLNTDGEIDYTTYLLIAGVANYKSDLLLSINQAFKVNDFTQFMDHTGDQKQVESGSQTNNTNRLDFGKWIYFLFREWMHY